MSPQSLRRRPPDRDRLTEQQTEPRPEPAEDGFEPLSDPALMTASSAHVAAHRARLEEQERHQAEEEADHGFRNRLALFAVISSVAGVGTALSLSLPLLSFVLNQRGYSPLMIGLNTATGGIAAILVLPFVARLARWVGPVRMILASFLVMAAALPCFYVIETFWIWFPLRFVFSAGITIIFALSEFWINSLAPPHQRGLVVGMYAACLSVGIAAGPLILAFAGPLSVIPFVLGTLILIAAAVPVLFVRQHEPTLHGARKQPLWSMITFSPMAMFAALIFGAVESGGTALMPIYGMDVGFTAKQAAILVSSVAIGNVVSQVPIGWLADKVDRRQFMIVCAALGFGGALALAWIPPTYGGYFTILFITGGIVAGLYTIGLTHLGARFEGYDLASANAAFVWMYSVGMLIGPASMGAAMHVVHPDGFPYAIAFYFGLYVIVGLRRMRLV